jgi:hypothetical protein
MNFLSGDRKWMSPQLPGFCNSHVALLATFYHISLCALTNFRSKPSRKLLFTGLFSVFWINGRIIIAAIGGEPVRHWSCMKRGAWGAVRLKE